MSLHRKFERTLDELWQRRTTLLRAEVLPQTRGKRLTFNKTVRNRLLLDLLDVTTDIVLRDEQISARYNEGFLERSYTQIKGRGYEHRFRVIFEFAREVADGRSFVYIFWHRRKCLYVGQAGTFRRMRAYRKSYYLTRATRFEIRVVKRHSELTMQECMTQHYLDPTETIAKPPNRSWGRKCPICVKHDRARDEILDIFSLKKSTVPRRRRR